jgi:hypothetical protein
MDKMATIGFWVVVEARRRGMPAVQGMQEKERGPTAKARMVRGVDGEQWTVDRFGSTGTRREGSWASGSCHLRMKMQARTPAVLRGPLERLMGPR